MARASPKSLLRFHPVPRQLVGPGRDLVWHSQPKGASRSLCREPRRFQDIIYWNERAKPFARAGKPLLRVVDPKRARSGERVGESQGIDVHAEVVVPARDRARLERLCRYMCRPPIAQNRLEDIPGGKLSYQLKKPWRDGTVALVLEPIDLIARVCALIPSLAMGTRRHGHMVRYHGVLSSHAKVRAEVVPQVEGGGKAARALREGYGRARCARSRARASQEALGLAPSPRCRRGREQLCSVRRRDALARSSDYARGHCQGARQARASGLDHLPRSVRRPVSFGSPSRARERAARWIRTALRRDVSGRGSILSLGKARSTRARMRRGGRSGSDGRLGLTQGAGFEAPGGRVQTGSAVHPRVFTVRFPQGPAYKQLDAIPSIPS